ncbi:MAG: M48 family metalloprotease [Allosphingosinicella sp.]
MRLLASLLASLFAVPLPAAAQPPAAPPVAAAASAPASTLRDEDLRVGEVAWRMAVAAAAICPRTEPRAGFLFHHLAEYLPRDRATMVAAYGLDRGPGVLAVLAGSPAARAGLAAGDVLLAANGDRFAAGARIAEAGGDKWRPLAEASEALFDAKLSAGPVDLLVLRAGREFHLTLGSVRVCAARARLARSTQVNAFHTGRYVVTTTALLAYLRNDDELALVLGHEMAHSILGHPVMSEGQGVLAGFGIGAGAIWQREAEADRFGLRLMAAAGYDLDAAIPFWRRYLARYDGAQIFRSHPSLDARIRIATEEIAAIRADRPFRP